MTSKGRKAARAWFLGAALVLSGGMAEGAESFRPREEVLSPVATHEMEGL